MLMKPTALMFWKDGRPHSHRSMDIWEVFLFSYSLLGISTFGSFWSNKMQDSILLGWWVCREMECWTHCHPPVRQQSLPLHAATLRVRAGIWWGSHFLSVSRVSFRPLTVRSIMGNRKYLINKDKHLFLWEDTVKFQKQPKIHFYFCPFHGPASKQIHNPMFLINPLGVLNSLSGGEILPFLSQLSQFIQERPFIC